MKKTPILYLVLLLVHGNIFAQNDEEAIYLKKSTSLEIDIAGNDLTIQENHFSEKQFLKNFEKHSRKSVYYSDFDPVTSIEALTLTPARSGFRKTKVSVIETQDIFQSGIFYGGYKRKSFVFPTITEGAIGRLAYSKLIKDVHLLSPFYFDEEVPVAQSEFSIAFPSDVSIRFKLFGDHQEKIIRTEKTTGGKIIYTWSFSNVPAYKEETDAPSRAYSAPHIIFYVESFQTKKGKVKVLSDVSDLYQWYAGQVQKIPNENQDGLKQLVMDLTKSAASESQKIKIIFQWVQHNIKYIAFENGMAGFIPRSSADVYIKRYGDCKDMANLLKDMLKIAGIEAHHTWIGTRSKPYSYQDVPTAIADNHMICSVRTPNGYVFLDATNPFLAFGKPSAFIQNKEALIGIGPDNYEVVKVPLVDRKENSRTDTVKIQLLADGINGEFKSSMTGFRKDDIEVSSLKAQVRKEREYIRDFFSIGDNNIAIDKVSIRGLGDLNMLAAVSFNFFQPGYFKNIGEKIYINLHLNKTVPGEKLDLNLRQQSLEQEYCYEDHTITVLTIPDGYNAVALPPNSKKAWLQFGISETYKTEGRTIILEKTIYSDFLYLDKKDFREWNNFVEAVNTIHQQSVTLSKIK